MAAARILRGQLCDHGNDRHGSDRALTLEALTMPCFVTPTHRYDLSTADDPLLLVLLARSCAIAARLPCHLPARPPPPRGSPSQPGTPAVRAQLADEPESYDPPPQLTRSQRLRRLETGLQRPTTAPAARPPAQQHISAGS
eukprot:COSAG06_NODE_23155_length_701_cov_0.936877_2_plen_140_part_01